MRFETVGAPSTAQHPTPALSVVDRRLLLAIRMIAIVGLSAASYLVYVKLANVEPLCATGGCEVILTSQWGEVFGIPVPVLGASTYILLLASTLRKTEGGRAAGLFLAAAGAAFSLFLQYQAIIVLEHFCPWCFTSACCMLLLAGLTAWRFLRDQPEQDLDGRPPPASSIAYAANAQRRRDEV